jgi:hypothetical protein
LVFNPSPFGRSGVVELPDRSSRVVTDVPGVGYAFLPDGEADATSGVPTRETLHPVGTSHFSARLDERTGAIASLIERASGRELVAPGGTVNAVADAVAADAWVERLPDVGVRIVVRRNTPSDVVTSKVTLYDALPWADIENVPDHAASHLGDWRFDLAHPTADVRREVGGGFVAEAPPVNVAPALRWLALTGREGALLFGSAAADGRYSVHVPAPGAATLTVHGGVGRVRRVRLALQRSYLLPDDPWRFGFGMLPLTAVAASGTGDLALPTFGRLLDVGDPAVAVLGIKEADDGAGLIAYLMDVGGPARHVAVRPGVLAFDDGLLTDLTERDRGTAAPVPGGGVLVPIESSGYAAVRLLGVRLAG